MRYSKQFCEEALITPPFEDDEQIEEWFKTHKIQIVVNDCVMEIEYYADAVEEIAGALEEIYKSVEED